VSESVILSAVPKIGQVMAKIRPEITAFPKRMAKFDRREPRDKSNSEMPIYSLGGPKIESVPVQLRLVYILVKDLN